MVPITDRPVLPLVLELELTLLFILKLGAFMAQSAYLFVFVVQVGVLEKVPAFWPFLSLHCYLHWSSTHRPFRWYIWPSCIAVTEEHSVGEGSTGRAKLRWAGGAALCLPRNSGLPSTRLCSVPVQKSLPGVSLGLEAGVGTQLKEWSLGIPLLGRRVYPGLDHGNLT